MKLIKSLSILSLSAALSVSAFAETKTQQATLAPKATAEKKQEVSELQRFTDSVEVKFSETTMVGEGEQRALLFKYQITNKSTKPIKQLQWASYYINDGKVVLAIDEPVVFGNPLQPKDSVALDYGLPWKQLSQSAQAVLANPKAEFSAQFQAKSIEFADGSKIEVK